MQECMEYISWLKVPENVETEIIGVKDADSMAAGYNAAMHDSDAKYKVYLHQDVFILNENFIEDVIKVFRENPEYGMLGVIGSNHVIYDANYYLQWNVGEIDANNSMQQLNIDIDNPLEIEEVVAIDGLLMVTQHDVEWREDILDSFDFYDVSQSVEFQKQGYKVGVPHQNKVWCNHFCGCSKLDKYDIYRKKICEEYAEYGYLYSPDSENERKRNKNAEIERRLPAIEKFLNQKQFDKMSEALVEAMDIYMQNTRLCELLIIGIIIQEEQINGISNGFYDAQLSGSELMEKYTRCRFLLQRLEYGKPIERMEEVVKWMNKEGITATKIIAQYAVADPEKVLTKVKDHGASTL